MYIPREYGEDDRDAIIAFMKRYNFAVVVTAENNLPVATHLPFHIKEADGTIKLSAHFARANPQWKDIASKEVLVIFSQPHAYVSPTHYDREQSVPTWNYMAVHAYGRCDIIENAEQGMAVLEEMILQSEPAYKEKWDGLSADYKSGLYKGIVPVEITITRTEAVAKLSQDKSKLERERITETLTNHEDTAAQHLAGYMRKCEE